MLVVQVQLVQQEELVLLWAALQEQEKLVLVLQVQLVQQEELVLLEVGVQEQ